MTVRLHRGDLPDLTRYTGSVAIDTETMGLNPHRDRLCVVQLSSGDGSADVVQIPLGHTDAPHLKTLLAPRGVSRRSCINEVNVERDQKIIRHVPPRLVRDKPL